MKQCKTIRMFWKLLKKGGLPVAYLVPLKKLFLRFYKGNREPQIIFNFYVIYLRFKIVEPLSLFSLQTKPVIFRQPIISVVFHISCN